MPRQRRAAGSSTTKRYADLSQSPRSKILLYKRILIDNAKVSDFKPNSVMKMKFVCEKRKKGFQGDATRISCLIVYTSEMLKQTLEA